MASEEPGVMSITSQHVLHPDEIARHTFPQVRRGVDGEAVRKYLDWIASELRGLLEREQALRRSLADAEQRAAEPELDEDSLVKAVGSETARILQEAHHAAHEVVARAEARAAEIVVETEDQTREEAVALLEGTRNECREMVREAKELRTTILSDLASRRRSLRTQLEELRAGRDSLMSVVEAVGEATETLRGRLASAEDDARAAAARAGDAAAATDDETLVATEQGALAAAAPPAAFSHESGIRRETAAETTLAEDRLGVESDASDEGSESPDDSIRTSVDELFARIRAAREAEAEVAAAAEAELAGMTGDGATVDADASSSAGEAHEKGKASDASADEEAAQSRSPVAVQTPANTTEEAAPGSSRTAGEESAEQPAVASETTEEPVGEVVSAASDEASDIEPADAVPSEGDGHLSEADRAALARRAEILQPVTTKLARALKRALQDDQNVLLDALRHSDGTVELDKILPEEEQRSRLEEPAAPLLVEAYGAGFGWLSESATPSGEEMSTTGESLAAALAVEVTGFLRSKLQAALASVGDVAEEAADVAGAAYREWRGRRVEGTAADYTTRAFASGTIAGSAGLELRWIVDDDGDPCPDCDDNALAGGVVAGEEFPTGQPHPPVHPGCRCLLVTASS
jgi:cell division septum initiation protein DivIVA